MLERITANISVNQAPFGTFVIAEVMNSASKVTIGSQTANTSSQWSFQTISATRAVIEVVMKVTRMTQTP